MRFPTLHIDGGSSRSMGREREKKPPVLQSSSFAGQSTPSENSSLKNNEGPSENAERFIKCFFCQEEGHYPDQCIKYPDLVSRLEQSKNQCSLCLRKHSAGGYCPRKFRVCAHCKKKGDHHRALCPEMFSEVLKVTTHTVMVSDVNIPESKIEEGKEKSQTCSTVTNGNPLNFDFQFRTALTWVASQRLDSKSQRDLSGQVRVVLDMASDRSYISKKLAEQMNPASNRRGDASGTVESGRRAPH